LTQRTSEMKTVPPLLVAQLVVSLSVQPPQVVVGTELLALAWLVRIDER
jgi:hypothetical protein